MVSKSKIGGSISGAVGYVTSGVVGLNLDEEEAVRRGLDGRRRVTIVETQNTFHESVEKATREMETTAALRERTKKEAYHLIVAYHREEEISDEEMVSDARETLRRRGLGEHQAVHAVHRDRQHPHVHVVVNRVHPSGERTWNPDHDYYRNMEVLREIERERGRISPREARQRGEDRGARPRLPSWKQKKFKAELLEKGQGEAEVPFALKVRAQAEDAFADSETWRELQGRLAQRGLQVRRKGRGGVVTDGQGREEAQLSSVSQKWSFPKLDDRFADQFQALEQIQNQVDTRHEQSDGQREKHGRARSQREGSQGGTQQGEPSAGSRREIREPSRGGGSRFGKRGDEGESQGSHVGTGEGSSGIEENPVERHQQVRGDAQQNPGDVEQDHGDDGQGGTAEGPRRDQADEEEDRTLHDGGGHNRVTGEPTESLDEDSQPEIEALEQEDERTRENHAQRDEGDRARRVGKPEDSVGDDGERRDWGSGGSSDDSRTDSSGRGGATPGSADDRDRDQAGQAGQVPRPPEAGDDRRGVDSVPNPLKESEASDAAGRPGMTEVERLTRDERAVWERLADGRKERAAREFEALEPSQQEQMVRKLDLYDRQDLREGYEQAIERDESRGKSRAESEQSESQTRSRTRSRGGISR